MSGAVAAHAAYNGSGTQGLAVTNKIQGNDGDVMSVFWNKNDTTRQLLYGSSFVEIQSSGASSTSLFGSSRLFTVNNDIDCLGDLYLQFKLEDFSTTLADYASTGTTSFTIASTGVVIAEGSPNWLLSLIDRIEVQVGTQIWQTIEKYDIKAVLASELTECAFDSFSRSTSQSSGNVYLALPSLFKTIGPQLCNYSNQTENGYLMAAAPNQSVKIKVSFVPTPTFSYSGGLLKYNDSIVGTASDTVTYKPANSGMAFQFASLGVDATTLTQFNTAVGITSASGAAAALLGYVPIAAGTFVATSTAAFPLLSACRLYGKHQIMCNDEREQIKAMPMGMPKRLHMTQNVILSGITTTTVTLDLDQFSLYASHLIITGDLGADVSLLSAELKLNSSSFSGVLPGALLSSATAETMGLHSNGNVSENGTNFQHSPGGIGTYVFPLASSAYGGSSVPLNRFDSIRLSLTFTGTPTTPPTVAYVSITCVGETTALYKGGAASLAMY